MKELEKYQQYYIQERLKEAENLKPFLSITEYCKVVKRIHKSKMFTVPINALPKHLIDQD